MRAKYIYHRTCHFKDAIFIVAKLGQDLLQLVQSSVL